MRCKQCSNDAVYRGLCQLHHADYVEDVVRTTIQTYDLFTMNDNLCVAVSGGKDSQVVLHLLHAFGYKVTALVVDEGIAGYRADTLSDIREFCQTRGIVLHEVRFAEEIGTTLDGVAQQLRAPPCSACGAWRRKTLNAFAQNGNFDYVVTGHNMDDEAQTYLMNVVLGRVEQSARVGIKTKGSGFVRRVKPLYFLSEKDIRLYTMTRRFSVHMDDCPYAHESFRFRVRDLLNAVELTFPGAKRRIVDRFISFLHLDEEARDHSGVVSCTVCGQPSLSAVCTACRLQQEFVQGFGLTQQ